MIFQKSSVEEDRYGVEPSASKDEVETIVGPSVNVEGDFASEGNIIVKGTVAGSVRTSKFLTVELGAKVLANVRAGSAKISGDVRGNMKIKESLEITSTGKVGGDIEVKTLIVEAGAAICGKVSMPGMENCEKPSSAKNKSSLISKKSEEIIAA